MNDYKRIIVVQEAQTQHLLKVCKNKKSFNQWLENVEWSRNQLKVNNVLVRPEM